MPNPIIDQIRSLLDQLEGKPAGAPPPNDYTTIYPDLQKATVNGVQFLLKAPLNPVYEATLIQQELGSGTSYAADPSNAPDGFALRSHDGFPLIYPLGGNHQPVGPGRVSFNGQSLLDDAEVYDYVRRRAANQQAGANWKP